LKIARLEDSAVLNVRGHMS